jgi:oxaloacetate decarboxylase gamma subunit
MTAKGRIMIDIGSLLGDAAMLMVTGMGVVFVFLTILVYLVRLMSRLVPEELPQPIAAPVHHSKVQQTSSTGSPQVIAAISAAVHKYRAATK